MPTLALPASLVALSLADIFLAALLGSTALLLAFLLFYQIHAWCRSCRRLGGRRLGWRLGRG